MVLQEPGIAVQVFNLVIRVPGHVEHTHFWPARAHQTYQFRTAHSRHNYVRQQEINFSIVLCDKLFELFSIRCGQNFVSRLRQYGLPEFPQQRLVLRQQNRAGSALMGFGHRRLPWDYSFIFDLGQRYTERGAFPGFALNLDLAVALFDDAIYGRETEASSLANLFRSEKWLEN